MAVALLQARAWARSTMTGRPMSPADSPPQPGFYGKVPALGDFVTRHMPAAFMPAWDAWLQALVTAARSHLAAAWPDAWFASPVWHFALGPGDAGRLGARGVLVTSVDRVGRFFPFTILGAAAPNGRPARDWALAAEALALDALEDGFRPDALAIALRALGPPCVDGASGSATSSVTPLPDDPGDWPDLVAQSPAPEAGGGVWWCRGTESVAAVMLRVPGLPGFGHGLFG